jgi:hypothetical protein
VAVGKGAGALGGAIPDRELVIVCQVDGHRGTDGSEAEECDAHAVS